MRAKRTLRESEVPFELPHGPELAARLSSVLEVIYLIFNEGYSATAGEDWMRPALCEEALRIGRILAELAPLESEVHGLVALMEIQASRLRARSGAAGEPVLLMQQNRGQWDRAADPSRAPGAGARGGAGRRRTARTCCRPRSPPVTPARAAAAETDWVRITALYDELARLTGLPGGRAQPCGRRGDGLWTRGGTANSPTSWRRTGGWPAITCCRACARTSSPGSGAMPRRAREFERAAQLTHNERERALLRERAADCAREPPG